MTNDRRSILRACLLVLCFAPSAFAAELCGDEDGDGRIDTFKTSGLADRDCDGQLSVADGGPDCDDLDEWIQQGTPTYADYEDAAGTCAAGEYRICNASGTGAFSSCTSSVLAERTNNYYFSAGGSGSTCSFASPCPLSYVTSGGGLTYADDAAFYFVGDTDLTTAVARTPDGGDSAAFKGFETEAAGTSSVLKNLIARYPTSHGEWTFASSCDGSPSTTADICSSVKINHASWTVRGIIAKDHYGTGVRIEADDVEVANVLIDGMRGENNNNQSGIKACDGCDNIDVHHSEIINSHDPAITSCGVLPRQNTGNVNFFGNSVNQVIRHSRVGYEHVSGSVPCEVMGYGIRWKHGNDVDQMSARSAAYGNRIWNVEQFGIAVNSPKTDVYGNLITDIKGTCFQTRDSGGGDGYWVDDVRFYDNTCTTLDLGSTQRAIAFSDTPTEDPVTAFQVTGNVIIDNNATCDGENLMVGLFHYGSNSLYTSVVTGAKAIFGSNCYYNPNVANLTNCFSVFGDAGAGASGSIVDFSGWKGTYSFDLLPLGYNEDQSCDADWRCDSANCLGRGWEDQWPVPVAASFPAVSGQSIARSRRGL